MRKSIVKFTKIASIIALALLIVDIGREWVKLSVHNQSPLNITTFEGSNSPYHPSVLYFENGWNNYKYWMAETPFHPYGKPYRDRNECPCIHVSNDGVQWTEVVKNPIDNLDSIGIKNLDYFSDTHLIMNSDTLECWYRITKRFGNIDNKDYVLLLRKWTVDGVHWSERDTLFNFTNVQKVEFVSPAILRNDSTYEMWYADDYKVYFKSSKNIRDWNNARLCKLNGYDCKPWHLDVIKDGDYYWLLSYEYSRNELTLWKSYDGYNFDFEKIILNRSEAVGSFYEDGLYRSCIVKINDNSYRVYFSASNLESTFLGLMEGNSLNDLNIVSVNDTKFCGFFQFLKEYYKVRTRSLNFFASHYL